MRLTISQLEALFWTAKLGSVQKAAEHLNLAQPTVSLRLRSLQEDLRVDVLERAGRGVKLTSQGERLFLHAQTILAEAAKIQAGIANAAELTGSIKVGVFETFAVLCLPLLLQRLASLHPNLRLEVAVSNSYELEQDISDHRLDMAFLVDPTDESHLRLVPLGAQEVSWVASPRLDFGDHVEPVDLAHVPILTSPPPSAMYRQISHWFSSANMKPSHVDTCTSVMVIAHMVAEANVVAILPKKLVGAHVAAGSMRLLPSRPPLREARVCSAHRIGSSTRPIDAVIRAASQVLKEVDFLAAGGGDGRASI